MKLQTVIALTGLAFSAFGQSVVVDGKSVSFDAPPRMVNGTLMVPVRNLFEAMDVTFRWRADREVIEGMRNGHKVEIWVNSRQARVDDRRQDMDEAPFVWSGRTYAPLKFLADSMGYMISHEAGGYTLQPVKR